MKYCAWMNNTYYIGLPVKILSLPSLFPLHPCNLVQTSLW